MGYKPKEEPCFVWNEGCSDHVCFFFFSYKTIHRRTSWKWDSIINEWRRGWKLIPTFFLSCYSSVLNNAHLSSLKFPGVRDLWEEVCWGTFFGRAPVRDGGKQDWAQGDANCEVVTVDPSRLHRKLWSQDSPWELSVIERRDLGASTLTRVRCSCP